MGNFQMFGQNIYLRISGGGRDEPVRPTTAQEGV